MTGFQSGAIVDPKGSFPWLTLISATAFALITLWGAGKLLAVFLPYTGEWSADLEPIAQALFVSPYLGIARMVLGLPFAAQLIRLGWFGWASAFLLGLCIGLLTAFMAGYPPEIPISCLTMLLVQQIFFRLLRLRPATSVQ